MSLQSQTQPSLSQTRRWDWLAALFLFASMQIVANRLFATDWVKDLQIVLVITLFGCVLGLALGFSSFSKPKAIFFVIAYGLFFVPWQLGLIMGRGIQWLERLASLWGRLLVIFGQIVGDRNVTDPLLFLTIICILAWILSSYAGFTLVRSGHPWQAILPGGIAIMAINIYSYQDELNVRFLAFYSFAALLLVARIHLLNRQSQWQASHIPVPFHVSYDLIIGTIIAAGLVILMAWNIPTVTETLKPAQESWQKITAPWDSVKEQVNRVFAALKSSVGLVTVGGIKSYYGGELPLGLGIPLTDDLIFSVEALSPPHAELRYYWRARYYEIYEDGLWRNARLKTISATPDQFDVSIPAYDRRWNVRVKFTPSMPISTLYAPSQPEWVSRPVDLSTIAVSDDQVEIVSVNATSIILPGEVYEVQASLSNASAQSLRSAGTEYPAWVTERYLQIPDSITPRTLALAEQIAADLDNPYDQVSAITNYLRTHIVYVDRLPQPPEDQEQIDWMLFDIQQGFCNYYATAEVLLVRALGIPARLAVGYSQGEPQSQSALGGNVEEIPGDSAAFVGTEMFYNVMAKNAHSWPEVYFPGLGWIPFEPTVNQVRLERPPEEDLANSLTDSPPDAFNRGDPLLPDVGPLPEDENDIPEDFNPDADQGWLLLQNLTSLIFILGLILLSWQVLRRYRNIPPLPVFVEVRMSRMGIHPPLLLRRWARWSNLSSLERSYHEINRALARLGGRPIQAATPNERAAILAHRLPESAEAVHDLLAEYQAAIYGAQLPNVKRARSLARQIRVQSYTARVRRLFGNHT